MSTLRLRIFDGTRSLFAAPVPFLITITDGNRVQRFRNFRQENDIPFDLPFFDNGGDNYTVTVWAEGFQQAGFAPVALSDSFSKILDVMLLPDKKKLKFSFVDAPWDSINALYPFLGSDLDRVPGTARYELLMQNSPEVIACILNLCESMGQIHLSQGTPLNYIKQLCWQEPNSPKQDRIFAWCDPQLIEQVKIAAAAKLFSEELNPGVFHQGATSSWKQIQFGEANVQLTFHERNTKVINGVECLMVEPDIDYFRDLGAHAIYEVIPNSLTHSITDPAEVYALRWIAGRTAGVPEFAPKYKIEG